MTAGAVLVINAGYEPMHRVSLQHAVKMLVRGVAVVEEAAVNEYFGPFPRPLVLRLLRYVQMRWIRKVPFSKAAVRARDGRCAYCPGPAETVDHIVPRSRGGRSTWLNLVGCCHSCNGLKADRTPEEAGMKLLVTPYIPNGLRSSQVAPTVRAVPC
ncbi:HNH endonuclease [Arthrobacter sp. A2-55]|uniref:HNH endonuclease n=1 Tax=Arthrobacter sp. A2-55 TaxID=2897337 RepID=UPI0021CD6254|nr:HNH endonuclease [Arthrobacter sp. A2-55]MCU6481303.1 HNH endonuclease [Arthrobacter sp. A2-55]